MSLFSSLFGGMFSGSSFAQLQQRTILEHGPMTASGAAIPAPIPAKTVATPVKIGPAGPGSAMGLPVSHPTPMPPVAGGPPSLLPPTQAKFATPDYNHPGPSADEIINTPGAINLKYSRNPMFQLSDKRGGMPDVSHVNKGLLERYANTEIAFGQNLPIVSGYRGETYNATHGGVPHSQHLTGNAIDIDVSGLDQNQQVELIKTARKNGIQGIGVYGKSMHFDLGRRRAWGPNHSWTSIPDWARTALND